MPLQFNSNKSQGKAREKYMEAEKRIKKIHNQYPDVEQAYSYLNSLKREYKMLKVSLFNREKDNENTAEELKKEIKQLEDHYHELLKNHNIPLDYKKPTWDCEKCHDTGRIYRNNQYLVCSCAKNDLRKRKQKNGNLPQHLHSATFANANLNYYEADLVTGSGMNYRENAQKIYSLASSFVQKYNSDAISQGLIIEGPIGSGKSYLLGCIANALIDRGIHFRYIVYSDLLQQIRSTYNQDSPEADEKQILNTVQQIPVLLIDDLGTEKATEFASSTLYQIIDHRYREEKPIILSTNYSIKNLKNRFPVMGERIFQRLLEMNKYLELAGNVRVKKIEERQEA
ncbi:ATP-binding protein [Halanaerobium congolense]|uniref:ATP-binding protein n=1 Tax=Halanaerobium congolense TaxID=54121 RepID=UPI0008851F3F|nr:ATP-binding protein [Halanaerobium congolense]SDK77792.1 replicative DNA helicase loader DnaI [Halanaerobium congolense]SDM51829.1 replicative DNA helicase loader DnaI [Halanaerobium congolense]